MKKYPQRQNPKSCAQHQSPYSEPQIKESLRETPMQQAKLKCYLLYGKGGWEGGELCPLTQPTRVLKGRKGAKELLANVTMHSPALSRAHTDSTALPPQGAPFWANSSEVPVPSFCLPRLWCTWGEMSSGKDSDLMTFLGHYCGHGIEICNCLDTRIQSIYKLEITCVLKTLVCQERS